jgi:hypothetical protein
LFKTIEILDGGVTQDVSELFQYRTHIILTEATNCKNRPIYIQTAELFIRSFNFLGLGNIRAFGVQTRPFPHLSGRCCMGISIIGLADFFYPSRLL